MSYTNSHSVIDVECVHSMSNRSKDIIDTSTRTNFGIY